MDSAELAVMEFGRVAIVSKEAQGKYDWSGKSCLCQLLYFHQYLLVSRLKGFTTAAVDSMAVP